MEGKNYLRDIITDVGSIFWMVTVVVSSFQQTLLDIAMVIQAFEYLFIVLIILHQKDLTLEEIYSENNCALDSSN